MAGFIELIAKIKPKNNGKYALVDDVDVEMEDGTRLSEAIKKPKLPDGGNKGQLLAKKSDNNGDAEWVDGLKMEDVDKKIETKLDKNLGSENPDKVLTTDSQGNITLQDKEDFEGSGVTDYNGLNNRPSVNGVTLTGNKTSADLDMYTKAEVDEMLYEKMDKPYAPITIIDDTTIEDCLDGYFKIDKIKGNTYQAEETDIVPTPQRPIPINSRKTTITKINPNIFDFEKENDISNIPDSGTYRSIGQHQLKPNTKYVFSWSGATVPAKATLSFQIQDDKGTVLASPFTYFNLESNEKEEAGKEVEFTTNSSGIVKFAYNCTVATSSTTETYQQYWYTKILKDISLKEDVEYATEYVELRSLKETINKFDSGLLSQTDLISDNGSYRKIEIPIKLKPNTRYKIYYENSMIPALTWAVLNIVDNAEEVLVKILNVKNTENNEVEKQAINLAFTSPNDGEIYFSYYVQSYDVEGDLVPQTTETFKEKWFTKILKNIMVTEESLNQNTYVPPTVRDYKIVDHTNKTSKIVRNVLEIDVNNIKAMLHTSNEKYISFQLNTSGIDASMLPQGKIGYCSLFLTKSWDGLKDYEMVWIATASMGILISKDRNISDVEQFLQFVKEKDIKIFAKSATPTEESILYVENDTSEVGYSWQDTTSPSPTIPAEVKGVEEIDILKTGKNLFDFSKVKEASVLTIDYENETITIPPKTNNDGYTNSLKDVMCRYKIGEKYVISAKTSNAEAQRIIYFLDTKSSIKFDEPFILTEEMLNSPFAWYNNIESKNQNVISNIQIELGDTATTYEPYTEQHVNITLPQPLYKNDIANVESGDYEYEKQKYVVTGDETFINDYQTQSGFYGRYFNLENGNGLLTEKILCNYLSYIHSSWNLASEGCCQNTRTQIHLKFSNDRLGITDNTPVEEKRLAFANYLKQLYASGDPLYVVVKVVKTTQPIPQEDLKLLKSLKTEQGVTNIFVGGEVKPTIEARYPQDIVSAVNKLQTKLLTLQEEVVKNV